jgi:hypothetical protein
MALRLQWTLTDIVINLTWFVCMPYQLPQWRKRNAAGLTVPLISVATPTTVLAGMASLHVQYGFGAGFT